MRATPPGLARLPRVPDAQRARRTLWAAVAGLALGGALVRPPDPGPVGLRSTDDGCRLAPLALGAACPCGAAPERVRVVLGWPLDANAARPEALTWLPGIGPSRAAAITAARPLDSLADLESIPGIGVATRRALEPYLFVGADPVCGDGHSAPFAATG